jgi:myo-inositol-1(or 4)-monophosphatase
VVAVNRAGSMVVVHDLSARADREVAVIAVEAGAAVLRTMYGTSLEQQLKSTTDFATAADVAAEQAMLEITHQARPQDGFVGEELGDVGPAGTRTWLVDPLCGTLNFAAMSPLFSVNVALVERGTTTAAAVSHPPSGEVYWADGPQFGILGRDESRSIPPTRLVNINADGPLDRGFVGAQLAADPDFRALFSPRVESTTLALAWVASGQRLGYVTDGLHRTSVHFAAGIALCQAAGIVITDFNGGLIHSGPGIIAAADHESHAKLLELVAKHRSA